MNHTTPDLQKYLIYIAILCTGYVACLFLTYGFIVMPGLATIDDTSFIAAFQGLETRFQNIENQSVLTSAVSYGNLPAMIAFPGAFLCTLIAIFINRKSGFIQWLLVALVLFSTGMITTVIYNLPSNEFIFQAGDPNLIDATEIRKEFNEGSWSLWNHFRALTSCLVFLCLLQALRIQQRKQLT